MILDLINCLNENPKPIKSLTSNRGSLEAEQSQTNINSLGKELASMHNQKDVSKVTGLTSANYNACDYDNFNIS